MPSWIWWRDTFWAGGVWEWCVPALLLKRCIWVWLQFGPEMVWLQWRFNNTSDWVHSSSKNIVPSVHDKQVSKISDYYRDFNQMCDVPWWTTACHNLQIGVINESRSNLSSKCNQDQSASECTSVRILLQRESRKKMSQDHWLMNSQHHNSYVREKCVVISQWVLVLRVWCKWETHQYLKHGSTHVCRQGGRKSYIQWRSVNSSSINIML